MRILSQLFQHRSTARTRGNSGFTLMEMVITVAVMAILISITTPAIFEFMRQKDRQSEEIALGEIRKAMLAYLADTGELPADTGTGATAWYNLLAPYTNLSVRELTNDTWGRPRTYILYTNTERKIFGNTVSVYYATLHSMGVNGKAENTYANATSATNAIAGMAVTNKLFDASTNSNWWRNLGSTATDKITAYAALRPGGDDQMLRFTNNSEVAERYNVTMDRLDRLTKALEAYARSGYAARVSVCSNASPPASLCANGLPEKTIYYPRSQSGTSATEESSGSVAYSDNTIIVTNSATASTDAARRTQMVSLMNRLGLPADFCCSALENSPDKLPKPFYYFSNPRARTDTGCATRPVLNDVKLPARITTKLNADSAAERTCG